MSTTKPTRMSWRWLYAALFALSLATASWFYLSEGQPLHQGKPLDAWLQGPLTFVSGARPDQTTNVALVLHAAGAAGAKLLLREFDAPTKRGMWLQFHLDQLLRQKLGAAKSGKLAPPPTFRAFEAEILAASMPPPQGGIWTVLTNRFQELTRSARAVARPDASNPRQGGWIPDRAGILRYEQDRLGQLARWLARNEDDGLRFLTSQMLLTDSPVAHRAILAAFSSWKPPRSETVPALVWAARHPENELSAAMQLTKLHAEPAVAVPILVRHAATNPVHELSLLAEWGTNAAPWLPQIMPFTTNSDPQVSFQAEIAVRKIQGR